MRKQLLSRMKSLEEKIAAIEINTHKQLREISIGKSDTINVLSELCILSGIPTYKLVNELRNRAGVKEIVVEPYDEAPANISESGPLVILVIND